MDINTMIEVFVPRSLSYDTFMCENISIRKPFSDELINFFDAFSKQLFKNKQAKSFPDLQSLAFWMRKSQILNLKKSYEQQNINKIRVARGLVYHIAPSNVDTIFIYSLVLSMLSGNRNVVRISSNQTDRQLVLLSTLNELLDGQFHAFNKDLLIINYPHDENITTDISSQSDVRVIWGGDNTITQISKCLAKPTTLDLKFANKYSYALIDVNTLANLQKPEWDMFIDRFINDAYWFGQQACSSPRTIFWLNPNNNQTIINNFWKLVDARVQVFKHGIDTADFINKLVAQQQLAIEEKVQFQTGTTNLVTRVSLENISQKPKDFNCGSGLFYEIQISNLQELSKIFQKNDQTISYFGIDLDELKSVLLQCPVGVDRVVPIGTALEFSSVWDGYDFIQYLTREIEFK